MVTLNELHLFRYRLPLKRPLPGNKLSDLSVREGIVIRLQDNQGHCVFGEVAPLPGFSSESIDDVVSQLRDLSLWIEGRFIPDHVEELSGSFERWLKKLSLVPSVRFGFESSVLCLLAVNRNVTLSNLLCDKPAFTVEVNGLLDISQPDSLPTTNPKILKVKINGDQIVEQTKAIIKLSEDIGKSVQLRLDANQSLTHEQFTRLGRDLADCNIDYIEEPLQDTADNIRLATSGGSPLPIALDESLLGLDPEVVSELNNVKAVILKPTLLGLERTAQFARMATSRSIQPVITSSFESSLGLTVLCHLSSALCPAGIAMGLDTARWFGSDLTTPVRHDAGKIDIAMLPPMGGAVDESLLEEL